MNRLFAIDMDGTCLNDRQTISEQNINALKELSLDTVIVPTTGRALCCLPSQLKKENFYRYVISSNGAVLTDIHDNRKLFTALLPNKEVIDLLQQIHNSHIGVSIHVDNQFLIQGKILAAMGRVSYGKDARFCTVVRDCVRYLEETGQDVEEVQLFFFNEKMKKELTFILDQFPDIEKAHSATYVELFSPQASKGNALKTLINHLHIQNTACIGDSENDFSMFEVCNQSFAMGNAIIPLKDKADHIVSDNNSSGVAEAITQYLMK